MSPHHLLPETSLDQCIKCNICTSACPVAAVTDLFPGPKYAAPQAGRFREKGQASPDQSVDYCSGCRVCNMVCPTGVKIAEINARARAFMVEQGKVPLRLRLRNNLIARADVLGKFAQPIAPLANFALSFPPARWVAEKALGISRHAPLPSFSYQRFTTWFYNRLEPLRSDKKVVYFHGCSTQYYEPRIGRATVRVLEALGFEVIVPAQNCCGLPLLSNGEFTAARRRHLQNVRHLVEYARRGIPIIGTSTSCTLTLKEEAPELLDMHDDDSQLVAQQTFDFNEFILHLVEDGDFSLELQPISMELPYHVPCQYRAHRLGRPGVEVLKMIPNLIIYETNADCCGIAGTYGYKLEKYKIAMQVGRHLFEDLNKKNPPFVICDSETCRWQITHATGYPAVHPVELLAAATRLEIEHPIKEVFQNV